MTSNHGVVCRYVDTHTGNPDARVIRAGNVYYSGDTLYSYGSHFPLVKAVKENGLTVLWLVNGDTASTSTARHQNLVRSRIALTSIPSVIIPFSALEAAGVDTATVRLLEALPDRWETTQHHTTHQPDGSVWHNEPIKEHVQFTDEELAPIVVRLQARYDEDRELWRSYVDKGEGWAQERWTREYATPRVYTVDDVPHHRRSEYRTVGHNQVLRTSRTTWSPVIAVTQEPADGYLDDGPVVTHYRWETQRHWLGESLIEGRIVQWVTVTCPSCRGRRQRKGAWGIPDPALRYHAFRDMLKRKGVDLVTHDAWYGAHDRHEARRNAAHDAWHQEWDCKRCHGVGAWRKTVRRTAKFLSGFDRNESRMSYFFCELPKTTATTVEDAIEALKPDTVRMAEQMGRQVIRQGDIFAVELAQITKRTLRKNGASFVKQGRLLNTNHVATEVAYMPDGTTIARGCLTHKPEFGRRPDHARVTLRGEWFIILKNTVPLTRAA